MQLIDSRKGTIGATLCLVTANLLAGTSLLAADNNTGTNNPSAPDVAQVQNAYDQPANELGTTVIDSAVLFYKEDGGRVQAIEPIVSIVHSAKNGNVFSARLTYDSLTGATPNGAAPWRFNQTFVTPARQENMRGGDDDEGGNSSTGASGGTTVTDPRTGRQVLQYTGDANQLPLDSGFQDQRWAVDLGFSTPLSSKTTLSLGLNGSNEQDYRSYAGRVSIAQEFNNKSTTLSVGVNFEHDISKPFFGTPVPLSEMSGDAKGANQNKDVLSIIAGVTQVMNRNWLLQLNYSFGSGKGYQTDPYKIVSRVNPISGRPVNYLYESRPETRTRHSVYVSNKIAMGSFVTDLSARYYHDSWGINSITAELSEHIPIGSRAYIQPSVRYYHQSAADFFNYYLLAAAPLPQFASADSRLDSFNAITVGLSGGYKISDQLEIYGLVEGYRQSKAGTKGVLPGDNANLELFAGTNAISVLTGFKFKF